VVGFATAILGLILAFEVPEHVTYFLMDVYKLEFHPAVERIEKTIFWVAVCAAAVSALYAAACAFPWRADKYSCARCSPAERWQLSPSTPLAAPLVLAFLIALCCLIHVEIAAFVTAAIVSVILALKHKSDLVLLFVPIVLWGLFLIWFLPFCTTIHGDRAFIRDMRFILVADALTTLCVIGSVVRYLRTRERYFIVAFLANLPGLILGLLPFIFP
jgi:hypothetical protein